MKITNSTWEEKNTGLKICEIIFSKDDDFQLYVDGRVEEKFDFSVVKIPVGNLSLVHKMEDYGYRYLENQLMLSFEVNQLDDLNKKWLRFLEGLTYSRVTENHQLNIILDEVNREMFEYDRFSLDPFWGGKVSCVRYSNWINEMYENNIAEFYIMSKNKHNIGFFSSKNISDHISNCPIAGIFNRYKSHGYFFALTWFWLENNRKRGKSKLTTSISSNNKAMHSFLSKLFFFRVDETYIVLRKILH